MRTPSPYQSVPGSAGLFIKKRVWLGPDHVLLVTSHVLSEQYRRFYYSDIQAIAVAEIDNPAQFYGWVLAALTGVLFLALLATDHAVWGVLCLMACTCFIVFAATRPSVRCTLKTQISTEPLPSLKSREGARAFVDVVKQQVEKVQGAIAADAFAGHTHVPGALAPPPLQVYKGGVHWAAFALMFAVAAVTLLRFGLQSTALANVLGITHLTLVAVAMIAAVKQHGAAISRVARMVIALALTWAAASYVTEQVIVATTIQDALRNPMKFDYWRDPVRDVAVANAVAYLALGFIGVFALLSQDHVSVEP